MSLEHVACWSVACFMLLVDQRRVKRDRTETHTGVLLFLLLTSCMPIWMKVCLHRTILREEVTFLMTKFVIAASTPGAGRSFSTSFHSKQLALSLHFKTGATTATETTCTAIHTYNVGSWLLLDFLFSTFSFTSFPTVYYYLQSCHNDVSHRQDHPIRSHKWVMLILMDTACSDHWQLIIYTANLDCMTVKL